MFIFQECVNHYIDFRDFVLFVLSEAVMAGPCTIMRGIVKFVDSKCLNISVGNFFNWSAILIDFYQCLLVNFNGVYIVFLVSTRQYYASYVTRQCKCIVKL